MNGIPRLGRSVDHLTPGDLAAIRQSDSVSYVDVTDAVKHGKGDLLAHGYWYLNPWVNTDVLGILKGDRTPEERALVRNEDEALWRFPQDYPERVGAIIDRRRRQP